MSVCNNTLDLEPVSDVKLSIGITFHELGLIISAGSGIIAIAIATYLIFQHALHYRVPREQKHIIRILLMIPVYAAVSFLSYYNFKHAVYFEVLRDCYEAFAIASFFTLLCNYLAPTLHDQKDFFRTLTPKNWIWPLTWCQKCTGGQDRGWLRRPQSGLTWFNINYLGVFQYCFIRVVFTIVAVGTEAIGRYCEDSLSPAFAHIWVMVFESLSVCVAMYALIQFYYQLRKDLASQRPFLKLLCIKLVIFFSFWQTFLISFLSSAKGPLQPTATIAYPDIQVGIPSMLLCIEMAIFAILHVFAFSWKPYGSDFLKSTPFVPGQPYQVSPSPYLGGFLGWRAFADAFNPWDIIKAAARSFRWLFVGRRTRRNDISYQNSNQTDGWGGPGAFGGPEDDPKDPSAPPLESQRFAPLHSQEPIPLRDGPPRYAGPHQGRAGHSHMQSEDDDTWAMNAAPEDDVYAKSGQSFEGGEEDRAGLLLRAVHPGARSGISPARSEIVDDASEMGDSPERHPHARNGRGGRSEGFDKETGIDEQFQGYGKYSWGKGPPGV